MKRGMFLLLYFFLFIFFAGSMPAYAVEGLTGGDPKGSVRQIMDPGKSGGYGYKEGEVLVKFKRGVNGQKKKDEHKKHHAKRIKEFKHIDIDHVQLDPGMSVDEAIARYKADPDVVYAEPNYMVHALDAPPPQFPNDALFNQLWGLYNTGQTGGKVDADIKAPAAWGITTGSNTVVVAVIDTGIDYTHEDLAANMSVNPAEIANNGIDDDGDGYIDDVFGINAITGTGNPMDDMGHGTHVAGTIGAVGNNAIGVAGVNWNVKMVGCKFLNAGGSGYDSDAVTCLEYVRDLKARGVNIVATNNSWGGGNYSQALHDAIQAQMQDNILFIAAAGNNYSDNDASPNYPSNYDLLNILSVAATDANDAKALFSNSGSHTVHVAAPGVNVLSTLPATNYWNIAGGYGKLSGTSMATPHATGLAALIKAQNPSWTTNQVLAQIVGTADDTGNPAIGAGRINAYRALAETVTGPRLVFYSRSLQEVAGNNNGSIDAGETINLVVELRNMAAPSQGVSATLSSSDPYVTITGGTVSLGDMATWTKATNAASPFVVSIAPDAPKLHKIVFSLAITANSGAVSFVESFEERVSLYAPGWPVVTGGRAGHPIIADVDHDGRPEVIIASDKVYVMKGDGNLLPGWPQAPGGWSTPSVGDIDNDGNMEIVMASFTKIYAWRLDGTAMPGFPVVSPVTDFFGPATLADLDGDGTLEIIVAQQNTGQVHALRYTGAPMSGWPVSTGDTMHSIYAAPAVGDIDGDGFPEVVAGTMGKRVFAWNHDGTRVDGWPVTTPEQMPFPATLGDVDNDGLPEIFIGGSSYNLYAFKGNGTAMPGWPKRGSVAALGDIDKDGYLEIVAGFRAYRADGTQLPGWLGMADPYWSSTLADIDNDGNIEIITRSTNNEIYAFHANGTILPDFPIVLGAPRDGYESSIALGDINGDGMFEMVTGSINSDTKVSAISLPSAAASAENIWPMYQHDARHTGAIDAIRFTTEFLREGTIGSYYSEILQAAGGVPPYTWSISSGNLPEGLTLNAATGEISGTPVSPGTASVTIRVADSNLVRAGKAFSISVKEPLVMTTSLLPAGTVGKAYRQTLAATGGTTPYQWNVVSGSLPAGLTLNTSTGEISGTPVSAVTSSITFQVADSKLRIAEKEITIAVMEPLVITTITLSPCTVDEAYRKTLAATGGTTPYLWSVVSGTLPAGLALNASTGEVSGTTAAVSLTSVTIQVVDADSRTATKALWISVTNPVVIYTTLLNPGVVGAAYSTGFTATGGDYPYSWSVVSGSLPDGLTLHPLGIIQGTPTSGGTFTFTVQAADVYLRRCTREYSLNVSYVITKSVPGGHGSISPVGMVYVASGGSKTFTFTPDLGYRVSDVLVDGVSVGNPTSYTFNAVNANHTITVSFDMIMYGLTVTKAGAGSGTVTSSPVGIDCGTFCAGTGTYWDTFTLTATPDAGSTFTGWSGACAGTGTCTVTTSGDKTVTATFARSDSITVVAPNGGEAWKRGSTYTIRWNYSGTPGANVKIELLKGGVVNRTITSSRSVGSSGSGSYSWKISSSQARGSDYTIRITSTSNSTYSDTSDANFTIQ